MILTALTAKQCATWRAMADHRMVICDGSVRSGKSIGTDVAWIDFIRHGPQGNLLMAGRTRSALERNIIDPLSEMLGPRRCRYVQGSNKLFIGGRQIYVIGANDERAQEKIRGVTLVGAYCDELSTFPESFWTMLLSRLSVEGARAIGTTNPDSPMHWLKRDFLDRAEELDLARIRFRLADNPYLPSAYVEAVSREYTGLWYKRFIEGEWVAAEGAVFDMLDITPGGTHIVTALPELRQLRLAIDYGTTNPFAAQLMGVSAEPCLYVAREWHYAGGAGRSLTDQEYVERLDAWLEAGCDGFFCDERGKGLPVDLEKVVVDPSAASFRAAWKRHMGHWPESADNAVLDGIRDTASLLGTGHLRIHKSCVETIREMSGYSWDTKAQEKGEDKPLKQDDHHTDATRYGVRSYRTVWRRWLRRSHRTLEEAA